SGRVTGAYSTSAVTAIRLEGGAGLPSAVVNPDGSFEFPAVLPGKYQIRLWPIADSFLRPLIVGNTDVRNLEVPVTLPFFNVSGRVADFDQLRNQGLLGPNLRLAVTLKPVLFAEPKSVGVTDGSFSFSSVQPGNYTLSIGICASISSCSGLTVSSISVTDRDLTQLSVNSRRTAPPPAPVPAALTQTSVFTLGLPADVASGNELL